jgi:hypothetical protein
MTGDVATTDRLTDAASMEALCKWRFLGRNFKNNSPEEIFTFKNF